MTYKKILNEVRNYRVVAKRNPDEIKVIAVSKTHPWQDIKFCYDEGCRDFGESRVQEALEKMEAAPKDIRWHFIGSLQRKKVRKVIGRFHLIHSVDTLQLAEKISEASLESKVQTAILLQVNTSEEASKHGFKEGEFGKALSEIIKLPGIEVKGLMTMAPLTEDKQVVRACFQVLKNLQSKFSTDKLPLKELSMGMSEDYRAAIEEGATYLRLGSLIFGKR